LTTILCYYFLDMILRAKVAIRSKIIIENKSRCCIFNVKSHTQQNNKNNMEKNISSYRQQWCNLWKNKCFIPRHLCAFLLLIRWYSTEWSYFSIRYPILVPSKNLINLKYLWRSVNKKKQFKSTFCIKDDGGWMCSAYKSPIPWRVASISSEIALILHFSE